MTWTGQSFSVGQVLTAAQMNNLQADITALANADSGAPDIGPAIAASNGGSGVQQGDIDSSAVGQGELKTSTGSVSTASSSVQDLVLPGGQYGFYPQLDHSSVYDTYWGSDGDGITPRHAARNTGSSQSAAIAISRDDSGSGTAYARQRYIQSSPTYFTKDGPVGLYMFLLVDSLGNILSGYSAHEAPWHYNGPTDIGSSLRDKAGYPYWMVPEIVKETWELYGTTFREALLSATEKGDVAEIERLTDRAANDSIVKMSATQELSDKDMPLIPHPFMSKKLDQHVVAIDLVSDLNHQLTELHNAGMVDTLGLFHKGYLTVDNNPLVRDVPVGVSSVSAKWKNTGA